MEKKVELKTYSVFRETICKSSEIFEILAESPEIALELAENSTKLTHGAPVSNCYVPSIQTIQNNYSYIVKSEKSVPDEITHEFNVTG